MCHWSHLWMRLHLRFILVCSSRHTSSSYDNDVQVSWFNCNHMNIHIQIWVQVLCTVRSCNSPYFPFFDLRTLFDVMVMHQRKFQLKMGLLTLTQIPCHHVLANEIYLNLKYCIGLKHLFNINLGIGIIKNYFFCLYFRHISLCFFLKFQLGELVGCGI